MQQLVQTRSQRIAEAEQLPHNILAELYIAKKDLAQELLFVMKLKEGLAFRRQIQDRLINRRGSNYSVIRLFNFPRLVFEAVFLSSVRAKCAKLQGSSWLFKVGFLWEL